MIIKILLTSSYDFYKKITNMFKNSKNSLLSFIVVGNKDIIGVEQTIETVFSKSIFIDTIYSFLSVPTGLLRRSFSSS